MAFASSEATIHAYLAQLGISFTNYSHPPAFTCEEMTALDGLLPAGMGHIKNLFLKDKKKRYYLVSALYETKIDLKSLAKHLEAPELRFARAEELEAVLGVTPGSVTTFALINDQRHQVNVVLDPGIFAYTSIGLHPLRNDMTTVIAPPDLEKFLLSLNYTYRTLSNHSPQ